MPRVTTKGQVTVPKEIRERLGIEPGDEVAFEETEAGYVIRKRVDENPFERWRGAADADATVEERMAELRGERRDDGDEAVDAAEGTSGDGPAEDEE